MKTTAYEKWLFCFIELLKKEGRGSQARIARLTKKTTKHVNDIVKGRRRASLNLQEQIAHIFGLSYADMLQVDTAKHEMEPFPKYMDIMSLPLEDRAWAIIQLAAEKHGVIGLLSLEDARKKNAKPLLIKEFLNGQLNEEGFYNKSCDFFEGVAARAQGELSKQGF